MKTQNYEEREHCMGSVSNCRPIDSIVKHYLLSFVSVDVNELCSASLSKAPGKSSFMYAMLRVAVPESITTKSSGA